VAHLFLGIDVGTTGTKAAVVDETGKKVGSGYARCEVTSPSPGRYFQDATEWKKAVIDSVGMATQGVDGSNIRALAISAQGGTLVPVDDKNQPLLPARSWLDRRAVAEATALRENFGARGFYERTGWPIAPNNTCSQLLALESEESQTFERAAYFLETASYLNFWLCGHPVIDSNIAGITQLMDVKAMKWDSQILDFVGVDATRLPDMRQPGEPIGTLSYAAAADLDLHATTTVVAGGHDQYCAALGSGVVANGDLLLSTGSAWVLLGIGADVLHDEDSGFSFGHHLIPDLWGHFGEVENGGVCVEWIRRLWDVNGSSGLNLEDLGPILNETSPGSEGVLFFPHFEGTNPFDHNDTSHGAFLGLRLGHERRHLVRAVMEGVAIQTALVLNTYRGMTASVGVPTVVGGATKNDEWMRLVASVFGSEVRVSGDPDAACFGAAALAASGSGVFPSVASAAEKIVAPWKIVSPESAEMAIYAELSASYELASKKLATLYADVEFASRKVANDKR
jgi:sugar (pentulose or hexulose) kinase